MSKQVIEISSGKIAQIIHMELIHLGIHNADEIYGKMKEREDSSVFLVAGNGVEIRNVKELDKESV